MVPRLATVVMMMISAFQNLKIRNSTPWKIMSCDKLANTIMTHAEN